MVLFTDSAELRAEAARRDPSLVFSATHLKQLASAGASQHRDFGPRDPHVLLGAVIDLCLCAGAAELAGEPGLVVGCEITAGWNAREVHVVALGIDGQRMRAEKLSADGE